MRRFFAVLLSLLCFALPAFAEEAPANRMQLAAGAFFELMDERDLPGTPGETAFTEVGEWISLHASSRDDNFTYRLGAIFDVAQERFIAWDDLFVDGDAAAERMEAIAEASTYDNAYAEYNEITPMPRDNFALRDGQLMVYYPPRQLSTFSGNAGSFAFWPYELEGLLREGVVFSARAVESPKALLEWVLKFGAFLHYDSVGIGTPMREADAALTLVDVPDIKRDYSVWQFEDPIMRGVYLLSTTEYPHVDTAVVTGVFAERMDFGGLQTSVSTKAECVAALGDPDVTATLHTADAYSLLPVGETLTWRGTKLALDLHFVEDVLHSMTLWEQVSRPSY